MPDIINEFDAHARREKTSTIMHAIWLYDEDEEARKLVDESPEYSIYGGRKNNILRHADSALHCWGEDYARAVLPGFNGEPMSLVENVLANMPTEKRAPYQAEFDRLSFSKNDRKQDYYALFAKIIRDEVRGRNAEHQRKQQELQQELEDVQSGLAEALPQYALGKELSPELMSRAMKFGNPEVVLPSLKRARAAVELVRGWNYGGRSKADFEDAVQARFERLKEEDLQPVTTGGRLYSQTKLQRQHSDEELMQHARADVGESYAVEREQIAALADVLSGDDGQLDKGALGAFLLAIDADAKGQQTVDSRFVRNAVAAMRGGFMDAADFVNRGNAAAGMIWQGPDMPAVYLDEAGNADVARAYDERVETLRGHLAQLEGRRLDAAESAKLHSWLLTKGGTIVGENVPYLAMGALGSAARLGYVGTAVLGGVANAPAMMNRSIGQAYAEGKKNAGFVGSVKGLAQSWAEAAFVPMPGGTAIVNRTLDALARKTISLPGAGKMIGAVWGNGLLRYATTTAGASAGELLGEEVLAQSAQYPVLHFARAVGMDLDEPEWQPFADSWKSFNDDPRQAAATVVYCSLMGAAGARGNAYAAREFAKEYRNLMAAGLKAGSARRLSLQAEQAASVEDMEKLCTDMREAYRREVQEGDPVALQKRLKKEGESFLEEVEVQMYARSGVRDYVLQRAGILAGEKTAAGLNRISLPSQETPDKPTVLEWTDEQLNAWVEMQHESKVVETMRELQARVAGAALGDAAVDEADIKGMLVNLRELPVRALARMERTGGRVTYDVLKDLAADAREQVAGFVEGGMSVREAYRQMSEIPGVRLGTLVNAAEGFTQRVEAIVGTPEGDVLGIRRPEDASTSVFRLNGVAPGQSVLLFNKGLATEREMVEDLIERDVIAATSGEHAVTTLAALEKVLRRVQSHLVRYEGGMRLLPKGKEASEMDIVEAFSTLAQSRFLLNHEQYSMPQEAHDTIEYVQKKLAHTQHLVALSRAWDAFAKSEEGRAFIEKEGATLERLMSDAGASVAGQYSRAKFNADAFEAVRLAYELSVASPEAAQSVLQEYEEEQQELDHPKEQKDIIPASESITGEALPLFDSEPVNQETGEQQLQPGEVERSGGNLGRGLVGERYVEVGDGSVLGVAEVEGISLSADVPQFKKKESAAGRVEADEDGTTHELAGGWNANAAPIHVWRRKVGLMEVISGRHRLAHARRNGVRFIQVRVYDESAARDARWAKLHDVEQNILDNTCNAIDVAYYFRHNPLTMAEAEARGLMPKTRAGEQTAASRIGLTVAANASDNTFALLVNGKCTAEDAYMACLIATTEDGQQLALESRVGKNGKKNSWEYVTALVRGAEQMQPADGGMLDLFGFDESFRESSEKLARYVAAVREGLKARISIFVNSSKLNRKADVAKELGVKLSTPEDATRLISRLANLDAAYERLDPDLGIPAKADAWDGKSAVPTKLDELAAGSSYSLGGVMTPEMVDIKAAAEKDGSFMKAPNGKPTNLTERQWLQVRTRAFKGWFGDWERAAELTIESNQMSYKEAQKKLAQDNELIRNEDTGIEVPINSSQRDKMTSPQARRKSISNGFTIPQHNAVVAKIRGVFKHAIKLGDYNDKNNDPNIESIKRFGAPVIIDGEKALAFLTVKCSFLRRKKRGEKATKEVASRLYSVELDEIVKLDGQLKRLEHLQQDASASSSEGIIAKFNAKVKEFFDDVSKVVDENGEPLVVYHGSPHYGFTVFDKARRGERDKGDFGRGFYFTPSRGYAATYGKDGYWNAEGDDSKVYACFLNIREPMQVQARRAENMERWRFEDAEGVMVFVDRYDDRAWDDLKNLSEIVVHESTQIKSATDNRGTFAPGNPDITFSVVGEPRNQMDERYMDAVKRGDMDAAQRMVNDVARMRGYMADSDYQGSECFNGTAPGANAYFDTDDERYEAWENGDFEGTISLADFVRRDMDPGELEWLVTSPAAYQRADKYKRESIDAIRKAKANKRGKVTIYRAVPADIKEASVRNGDWVTFSKSYAEHHISLQDWEKGRIIKQVVSIDDVWWDNNDVNEWGYDDGKEYAYRNTTHNRKLLDAVTYDKNGDIVPLSKRFDYSSPDITFSVVGEHAANWDKIKHRAFRGRDDGKLRVELDASRAKLKSLGVSEEYAEQEADMLLRKVDKFVEALPAEKRALLEKYIQVYKDDYPFDNREEAIKEERRLEEANKETLDSLHAELNGMVDRRWIEAVMPGVDYREAEMLTRVREYYEKNIKIGERRYLQDVLDFAELYEAYPKLRYTPVSFRELGIDTYGQVERRNGKEHIVLNKSLLRSPEEYLLSTLLHEVQHAIQDIEGFAKGANSGNGMATYMRSAGEIEARNVAMRRDWPADERAAYPFNSTLEYPGEALVSFSIQSVMADWSAVLDRFVVMPPMAGTVPYRKDLLVCPTPAVMQMVGAKGWDIVMSHSVLVKCLHRDTLLGNKKKLMEYYQGQKHEHDILLADMRQLPTALADPVCIVISDTSGCLEVVTELKEGDRNILVAVQLNSALSGRNNAVKVNRVVSLYGKDKIEAFLTHPRLYWNKAKARVWVKNGGLQSSTVVHQKRSSGQRVLKPADLVKYKMEKGLSFSLSDAASRSLRLLERRSDEAEAQILLDDMRKASERLGLVIASGADARSGEGLKVFAEMQALISATRRVLPEKYLHQGRLDALLRWAAVYARMAQEGKLPESGAIKGAAYDKFVQELTRRDELAKLQGMSEEDAGEVLAQMGAERLERSFMKVGEDCARRLDQFLKDRALERIEWLIEHAYPKREEGRAWRRGKLETEDYKTVEEVPLITTGCLANFRFLSYRSINPS